MSLITRVSRNPSTLLVGGNISGLGLGLVSAALQARLLGPVGRGELAAALVPATVITMLLCFGLPDYFSRRAAIGDSLSSLSKSAGVLAIAIGVIAFAPYFWFAQTMAPVGTQIWVMIVAYAALSPVFVYGYCLASIAVGAARWGTYVFSRFVTPLLVICGLLLLSFIGTSAQGVGLLLIGTSLIGLLVPLAHKAVRPSGPTDSKALKAAVAFGLTGWPAGAVALLNQRVDLLMLTVMASKEDLGFYAVSVTLAAIITGVAYSVAMPIRNRVSRGENHILPFATALVMAITLALAVAVWLTLPILVSVVLGTNFLTAIPIMRVLVAAQVPLAGIVMMTQCLIGAGHPGRPLAGEISALAVTVCVILFLVPTFGVLMAAYANLAGNVVSFGVLLFLSRRYVSSEPTWRYLLVPPSELIQWLKRK